MAWPEKRTTDFLEFDADCFAADLRVVTGLLSPNGSLHREEVDERTVLLLQNTNGFNLSITFKLFPDSIFGNFLKKQQKGNSQAKCAIEGTLDHWNVTYPEKRT